MKASVLKGLKTARRQTAAKVAKVDAYCNKKLVLKAFFGMLKFVEGS